MRLDPHRALLVSSLLPFPLAVNKKGRDLSYDRAHGCRLCRRSDLFFLFLTACSHGSWLFISPASFNRRRGWYEDENRSILSVSRLQELEDIALGQIKKTSQEHPAQVPERKGNTSGDYQENLSREYVQGFQLPGLLLFFCWKLGPLVILVSSLLSSRPFQESIRL